MRTIAETLAGALPRNAWEALAALARVQRVWEGVVGKLLAGHAVPVEVRNGTLVVAVDHALFGAQLREQARLVLRALRRHGAKGVARLWVVVAPERVRAVRAKEAVEGQEEEASSWAERKEAARLLAPVMDRKLKRAMFRAMLAQARAKRFQEEGNGARS